MLKKLGLMMCAWTAFASCGEIAAAAAPKEMALPTLSREEESLARDFKRGRIQASPAAQEALKKETILVVSRLTHAAESPNYTRLRKDIELSLSERKQTPEARAAIVNTLITYAGGIAARSEFSPAARINCTAILAELDEAPETRVAGGTAPPQPAKAAFRVLKGLAGGSKIPDYIRSIALLGLERHARVYWNSGWDDATKQEVIGIAVNIISSKPATDLDVKSHSWMVRRAYDLLSASQVPSGANAALGHVADPDTLPSVRLAALSYLSSLDLTRLPAERKAIYLVGVSHFIRGQLVNWYEFEEDIIKRDSNAQAVGGAGAEGGGMMGGSDYSGDMGDMTGGGEGAGGMMGGMGRGGYGGGGLGGFDGDSAKPIETQDWQTRAARRMLNQITQTVHIALDGRPLASESVVRNTSFASAAQQDADILKKVNELVVLLEEVQTAINDPDKITDVSSLLTSSQVPIENIMDFVTEVPGFAERYPELADEEELEAVPEKPATPPAEGGAAGEGAAGDPPTQPNGPATPDEAGLGEIQ